MIYVVTPFVLAFVFGCREWREHDWAQKTFNTIFDTLLVSGTTSMVLWINQ